MSSEARIRAAAYCRISEDPREIGAGVLRQREDCEHLIAVRGWLLVDTFTDNDVAVLRAGAGRPGYERLLAAVGRGEVDRVVAYGLSRLVRNRRERAEMIEHLARHRVSVALVKGSDLDLTSAAGRAVAGLLGEMDTMESEVKAERVARAALQRAEQGRANGHAAYGWRRERTRNANGDIIDWHDEADPDQAPIVAEIVRRLLAGEAIRNITLDLNRRGVPPPGRPRKDGQPPRWGSSTVRKIALRPANVADRVHQGRVIGAAAWPPLVSRDQHDRVTALLTDPRRRTSRDGARKHLLSFGIGVCGLCESVLRVQRRGGHELYVCDGPRACVGRRVEWVDDFVSKVVVARLAEPDAPDLLAGDDEEATSAAREAAAIRARLDQIQDDHDQDLITRDQYLRGTARWRTQLTQAERKSQRAVRGLDPDLVAAITGGVAGEWWYADTTTVTQRRALMEAMRLRVIIQPGRGGPGFKPELIEFEWDGE